MYQEVPGEELGLGVERLVPCADGDLLAGEEVGELDVDGPEAPAPAPAVLGGLLRVVQHAEEPCLTAVQRHLNSRHFLATTYKQVGIQ